jgi:hypothetical protein
LPAISKELAFVPMAIATGSASATNRIVPVEAS